MREIKVPVGRMIDTPEWKVFRSKEANFNFNKVNGYTEMWGATTNDDVEVWPFPNILDIEISESCKGPNNRPCSFCYKASTPSSYNNMSLETFKSIIDKMPWLQQLAIGTDAHGTENPALFEMMEYSRSKGIIPNITLADVSTEVADKMAKVAGAVAVSVYKHAGFDVAYDSIKRLIDAGKQNNRVDFKINIHFMVSAKTISDAYKVADAYHNDSRLQGMGAIVFLGLKTKGRGSKFDTVTHEEFKSLVDYCLEKKVPFGFDSCSGPAFAEAIKDHERVEQMMQSTEPCESTCLSSYINADGNFFPCSFTEGEGPWKGGINVMEAEDFVDDVWNHERTVSFREQLIGNKDSNGCRNCPVYAVCGKDMRTKDFKPQVGDIL